MRFSSTNLPLLILLMALLGTVFAFQPRPPSSIVKRIPHSVVANKNNDDHPSPSRGTQTIPLHVTMDREPDMVEMMMGGQRYEMVPLPDRMCDTTIIVKNICEFVHDEDLSDLFQTVSVLQSVPSVVVRKANMQSLRYGFVSFLSVEEKEAAILNFHGREWKGKRMKVECIVDDPKFGRVRVPEKIVSYVSGSIKKTRNGKVNSMRTARDGANDVVETRKKRKKQKAKLRKKTQAWKQNRRKKGRIHGFRLSQSEQDEVLRACKHGFLTLDARRAGHGSLSVLCSSESLRASNMAMAHRDWCDERAKPNIILYKASGRHRGELLDYLVVDLSPLRDNDVVSSSANNNSNKWTTEILDAAANAGMELRPYDEAEECAIDADGDIDTDSTTAVGLDMVYTGSSRMVGSREPISNLPFVSMGFFVGERSKAKAMAKELSLLWDLPEVEEINEATEDDTHVPHGEGGRYQNNHGRAGKKKNSSSQEGRRAKRRRIKRDDWEQSMGGRYLRY